MKDARTSDNIASGQLKQSCKNIVTLLEVIKKIRL
jgi:hypothetical protein